MRDSGGARVADPSRFELILREYRDLNHDPELQEPNVALRDLHFRLVAEMQDVPRTVEDAELRLLDVESTAESIIHNTEHRASIRQIVIEHWKLSMAPEAISGCAASVKRSLENYGISVGDRILLGFAVEEALRKGASWDNFLIDTAGTFMVSRISSSEQRARIFREIAREYQTALDVLSFS